MADSPRGYSHDASDKKLDKTATAEGAARDASATTSPQHDPAETSKHDDAGKDRLFEGRQQHDEAEKNSEKTRLARDVGRHDHQADDDVADAGSEPSAKQKS
ncbi:MAG: hypothetical protein H0W68_13790 [Gemmatimonadaceae bacterium]|nr:hypothetical protein [Gemmatimonadaceae bacterium]